MTTYTTAEVNTWFQTIDGLPTTTAPIPSTISAAYVAALNATPPTATVPQIQANLENYPFNSTPPPANVSTDLFYRTSVADFVLTEFQLAWGVVPTSGSGSQYDNWVARVIADPSLYWSGGGMSQALIGTPEFGNLFGTTNPNQLATIGIINQLCANCGITPGAGAMANVGLPIWQVLQNFAESAKVFGNLAAPIANFQNLLLAAQVPTGSLLTLPGSAGATFTLTPNPDTFSTSTAGAVFNAFPVVSVGGLLNNTLNAGDNLNDTVGDGTLNYTASGSSFANPSYAVGVTLNGIKTLNYIGSFSFGGDDGGFQGSVTGLTVVNDTGSTGGLQLGGIGQGLVTPLTTVNISGYAPIGGIGVGTPAMFRGIISAAAGTSTTPLAITITGPVGSSVLNGAAVLAAASDGSAGSAASPNAAYSAWDLTLNSNANLQLEQSNAAGAASVGGVTSLTLSGAGNVFLGQDFAGDWQKLTTIDASAETGTVVITGASSGAATNAFASPSDPGWFLGSAAGLLNEGATGTFALTTFDLGTGTTVLDVSSATAAELAAMTFTPASTVAADNVIIVSDAAATAGTSLTNIAGFSELGVTGASGTINMTDLPTSITDIIYFTPATGAVTISSATDGLTVDFHGNNTGGAALTVNGPTSATATLNLDFGNAVLALEDHTGLITTTGYSTVDITPTGNGVAGDPDTVGGLTLSSTPIAGSSAALTVDIGGTQSFNSFGGITDVAGTGSTNAPTSAKDVITVTDTGVVDIGDTNFGTVTAAPSAGLDVSDTFFNSLITGSGTGVNFLQGGDGGGLLGTGNTFNGGTGTDTITTGIGSNTVNLGATHTGDIVTIGSWLGGVMTSPGDLANQGAWGQAHGSAPEFIGGTVATSIFGNAANGGTDASVTTINNFSVATGSTDSLHFQAAMWAPTGSPNNLGGTGINVGLADIGITTQVAAGSAANPDLITTSGQATTAGSNIVEIGGINTFSGAPTLAAGLAAGGSFDLTFGSTSPLPNLDNIHFLVAYSDAHNIHIADVDIYNTSAPPRPTRTS